jgi:hypothetical protein
MVGGGDNGSRKYNNYTQYKDQGKRKTNPIKPGDDIMCSERSEVPFLECDYLHLFFPSSKKHFKEIEKRFLYAFFSFSSFEV